MRYYFLLFIIFSCIKGYSQNSEKDFPYNYYNDEIDKKIFNSRLNKDLKKYYRNIYKAENFITKNQLLKASKSYEKAFKFLECPFHNDLMKARYSELNSRKKYENIKKYTYLALKKSNDKSFFLNDKKNQSLDEWLDLKFMIDTMKQSIDTVLINALEDMLVLDQSVRFGKGTPHTEEELKNMNFIDSINYSKLMNIIDTCVISEEKIGPSWHNISLFLIHNWTKLDFYIAAHQMVMEGKLDARKYFNSLQTSIYKINNKYPLGDLNHGTMLGFDMYIYYLPTLREKLTINKFRKKLFLESLNKYHKKYIYQLRNPSSPQFYDMNIAIVDDSTFKKIVKENIDYHGRKVKVFYKDDNTKKNILKKYIN